MRRISIALAVASLAACQKLDHENAYDPQTPADQQARTSFSGSISLEAVGGVTPSLAGVQVSVAGTGYEATTDASGHYVIAGVPAGSYTVQAVVDGYETAAVTGVTATLDTGGTTVAVPTLSLRRVRADVAGTVDLMLPDGSLEDTGGASVSIAGDASGLLSPVVLAAGAGTTAVAGDVAGTALTDGSGTFVIPDVPAPIGSYTLTASKLGYVTQTSTITFESGAFVVQTVQLQIDPGAIVGSVHVSGAADSFGVTVRARGTTLGGTAWEDVTTTDALGAFRLSGLPAGTYAVSYERADLVTASTSGCVVQSGADTTLPQAVLLPATGAIAGVVQLSGAASSAGVVVTAAGPTSTSTVTDGAGAFTLSGLPVGSYTVTARKDPDWQPSTPATVIVARDQTTALAAASLAPWATASIAGVALLEGATDASDTTVTLTGTDFRGVAVPAGTTTGTAPDGSFAFSALRAGSYQVRLAHATYDAPAPVGVPVITGQAASVGTITLAASRGSAGGTIVALGAASNAGTVVEIAGGPDAATAVTDASGTWHVSGLRVSPGYTATYRRTGYATPAPVGFAVLASATTVLAAATVDLSRTASIGGVATVVRPAGADASAGILVSLTGTDLNGASVTASTTTVSGGSYTLADLPQGTYSLAFSKSYYDPQTRSGLAVMDGSAVTAPSVALPVSTGTIAGQILLSAGSATGFVQGTDQSGAVVTLGNLEPGVVVPAAVTDASGSFRFDNVPVHTSHLPYTVVAQRSSYVPGNGSVTAEPDASVAVAPNPITLSVSVGSVGGSVAVNDSGTPATPPDGSVTVSLTGTAFNSTAFARSATNIGGSFSLPNLPAGTYDVVASSSGRACPAATAITVEAGQALALPGTIVCTDSVAPGSVALGTPQGAGASPGFTSSTAVAVPIVMHASDGTGNVRGYEYVAGAVPSWTGAPVTAGLVSPIPFPAGTLTSDGTWTLWVRAMDWAGNAGPASSVQVVRDTQRPADVAISTARTVVDATSTTAIITGGNDANFRTYQSCTSFAAATASCPASPSCTLADTAPSIAITFAAANTKACVYARAVDEAGNTSANTTKVEIVSDMTPPTGPAIAPLYDPTALTVHADYVDFRITAAATDQPGAGAAWQDIAWVEADTGGGYTPICPQDACRAGGTYQPCSCGCTDPRLVCNGTDFFAIRMPLNGGTANTIAVRAVDVAGNVGSGASQQVLTSGVLSAVATSVNTEQAPHVRGRTLVYSTSGTATVVDLGANLRFDPTDPICAFGPVHWYEFAVALLDPDTIVYSTGSAVKVRRRGASFCSGYGEATIGTLSAGYTYIHDVAATLDPATGQLERVAWAENDTTNHRTRLWTRDPGTGGKIDAADAPLPVLVYEHTGSMTSRLVLGGDALLVRTTTYSYVQFIDGTYTVLNRPPGGWGTAAPVTLPLDAAPPAMAASLDARGSQLAWVANDPTLVLHVVRPGPDGVFGTGDDSTHDWTGTSSSSYTTDLAVEGGHVVMTEFWPSGAGYLWHWTAGPDGAFGGSDDGFARILPTSAGRALPALGDGLGGGVAYFAQSAGNNYDLFSADLSALRWDTLSDDPVAVYPRSNRVGTYFFGRADGVWARAPDGQETASHVDSSFYAADGDVFAADVWRDVWLYRADPSGRFFTPAAPAPVKVLANKAGYGFIGASVDIAVGDGRIVAGTCEAADGSGSCTEKSVTLLEPNPTPATPLAIRIDRPADGAPANTYVAYGDGMGASASHVVYTCSDSGAGIGGAICVREPGPNRKYDLYGSPGYDDVTFLLRQPGTGTTYSGTSGVKLDGNVAAFFEGSSVVALDAGPDGKFNTADDVETVLGTTTQTGSQFLALAGSYVAWMTSGATGGPEPWVADVRNGTTRQCATHYSSKYGITVDRTGRVLWDDHIFSTLSVFVSAP